MIPTFPYMIYAKVAHSVVLGYKIPTFSYVIYGKVGIMGILLPPSRKLKETTRQASTYSISPLLVSFHNFRSVGGDRLKTRGSAGVGMDGSSGRSYYDCPSLSQTKAGLEVKSTKSGRERTITLPPPSTIVTLESHRKQQDAFRDQFGPDYKGNLIFANPDGTPLKPDSISASVSLLFRRLKLPKHASLHTLTHTHGSHLLANGTSLPAISKRLGHSNVYVTAIVYAYAIDGQDEEAARKWDEFQQRPTSPVKRV